MTVGLRVRLPGYVRMDNHDHLLLELKEANLSRAVQELNVSRSVWLVWNGRPNAWNAGPFWDWGSKLERISVGGIGMTWKRRCGRGWSKARGNRCGSG
jgi:hypothetical protein